MAIKTLKKNWNFDNWKEWRWEFLYQIEVQLTINANLEPLRKLYKAYVLERQKFLELKGIAPMIEQGCGLGYSTAMYCFGMSKMTIVFEKNPKKAEM